MLFTQFNMDDALEVRYEEGFEDGEEKGQALVLIRQVCRKLQKGKTPQEIAEELEEEQELIDKICAAVEQCGVDSDIEDIYAVYAPKEW